jgi:glycosyltransferase involved in cell wall biosynthesis
MRLAHHYHVAVKEDENGSLWMPGFQGRFIDSLAGYCNELYLLMHTPGTNDQLFDYRISEENVHFISLGPRSSVPKRMLSIPRVKRIINENKHKFDCALVRGPSPLLPIVFSALEPLPTALFIVGDYLEGVDELPQPSWRKQLIKLWTLWNTSGQMRALRKSLVFVNSMQLHEKFKPFTDRIIETRTTTLSESDFFIVDDRCTQSSCHLLYTGRIDRTKGLHELIESIKILIDRGTDVHLDIVGWSGDRDPTEDELKKKVNLYGLAHRVFFRGFKPLGPELFSYYKKADFYIIPSYAEGFPRSIWEAMAHSVPVIATRVGSISAYVKNLEEGILIPPRDPSAIVDAVEQLIGNSYLRQKLIKNGRKLAGENTLQKRTGEIVKSLKRYCNANT